MCALSHVSAHDCCHHLGVCAALVRSLSILTFGGITCSSGVDRSSVVVCRDSYRAIGLYWVGSFLMHAIVYILGNAVGKYTKNNRMLLDSLCNSPWEYYSGPNLAVVVYTRIKQDPHFTERMVFIQDLTYCLFVPFYREICNPGRATFPAAHALCFCVCLGLLPHL